MEKKGKRRANILVVSVAILILFIAQHYCLTHLKDYWEIAFQVMVLSVSTIILTRTKITDCLNVWNIIGIGIMVLYIWLGGEFDNKQVGLTILKIINCVIYGSLLTVSIKQKRTQGCRTHFLAIVNLILLAFCVISRNNASWPLWFLPVFWAFYLIPATEYKKEDTVRGINYGIIVAFIIIQGHAFILRPYDEERYLGMFRNPNINAMFYLLVLIACLTERVRMIHDKSKSLFRLILLFFACCDFSLTILTGCRTVLVIMVMLLITTVIYMLITVKQKDKIEVIKETTLTLATLILALIVSFAAVRYMPAFFHHPIWYYGEYTEEKVHSFDPIDSEKYCNPLKVSIETLKRFSVNKVDKAVPYTEIKYIEKNDSIIYVENEYDKEGNFVGLKNKVTIAQVKSRVKNRVVSYWDETRPGEDQEHPAYVGENYNGFIGKILGIRRYIYEYYLRNIKFMGDTSEFPVVWIVPSTAFDHCHNNIIEMLYCFGVIPALLFVLGNIYGIILLLVYSFNKKKHMDVNKLFALMIFEVIFLFGMTECCVFGNYVMWWMYFMGPFILIDYKIEDNSSFFVEKE